MGRNLTDGQVERGNCGVGFVARLDGVPRHEVVDLGARVLVNLEHRGAVTLVVESNEPLWRRPKNGGVVAAPAMRVRVAEVLEVQQRSHFLEVGHDLRIGLKHLLPGEAINIFRKASLVIDRTQDPEAVVHAGDIIVITMPRGGVNAAGTGIERDIVAQDQKRLAGDEGVARLAAIQQLAPKTCNLFRCRPATLGGDGRKKFGSDNIPLPVYPDGRVLEFRMEGNGQIGGQCPGRGGPSSGRARPIRRTHRAA